ncbi:MAG: hypothetical protein HYY13_04650 [Nitrospirae bacterium]|nr:hypothetical protein [Nitrospirota bacterium]
MIARHVRPTTLLLLVAALLLPACGVMRASPLNTVVGLQQHQLTPDAYTLLGPVQGSECGWSVLYFLQVDPASTMEAYQHALSTRGADFIIEPRTELEMSNYVVYQDFCVHVWGLGAKLKGAAPH